MSKRSEDYIAKDYPQLHPEKPENSMKANCPADLRPVSHLVNVMIFLIAEQSRCWCHMFIKQGFRYPVYKKYKSDALLM